MTTLELIRYLCQHPEREVVVIKDNDDMNTLQAIEYLVDLEIDYPGNDYANRWQTEEEGKSTLYIY